MTTTKNLEKLCEELTAVSPPPNKPMGVNRVVPGSGRWVLAQVGSGTYAVRAEYQTNEGGNQIVKMENEITGFAPALTTSLKFAISLARANQYYWLPI